MPRTPRGARAYGARPYLTPATPLQKSWIRPCRYSCSSRFTTDSVALYLHFYILPWKSVTPNLVASLMLFGIALSFIIFISSSERSTNRRAGNVIITSRQMIMTPDDIFLDQSEHRNLYIHLCNYTNNK